MKSTMMRTICRLLIVAMFALPFQTANAGMIGTDRVFSGDSAQAQRSQLLRTMSRPDVVKQLESLGVSAEAATQRVAAMSDAEVKSLAGHIESLPAGADSGWGWLILIALVVWAWYSYR